MLMCVYGAITLFGRSFQTISTFVSAEESGPLTLHLPQVSLRDSVWTIPISLAANKGISIGFFSFPY